MKPGNFEYGGRGRDLLPENSLFLSFSFFKLFYSNNKIYIVIKYYLFIEDIARLQVVSC